MTAQEWPVRLVVYGRPVSWKNSHSIARAPNGRRFVRHSDAQAKWLDLAVAQLRMLWRGRRPISKHIELNAAIVSYLGNARLIDASNLYQGPEDAMQHAEVLEDDVCIRRHDGSDRLIDRGCPRVVITLTPVEHGDDSPTPVVAPPLCRSAAPKAMGEASRVRRGR